MQRSANKSPTNSSRYILESIHTYIHTYIHTQIRYRYDMHHSSMCGTVLSNAVYVLRAKVDI